MNTQIARELPISGTIFILSSISHLSFQPMGRQTVSCVNNINVNLVMPPAVNDNCGNALMPVGPSSPVYDPPAFACEGTVTYTWTYTDCEGNSMSWDYVFTVDQPSPTELGGPVLMILRSLVVSMAIRQLRCQRS